MGFIIVKQKLLDLGCGTAKHPEAFGIDAVELEGVDLVYDLNKIPYPFKNNQFEKVIMNDILEHLDKPIDILREVYRILKPKGTVEIRVLYWNHKYNYSDPQHKHAFTEIYFEFFCGKRRPYYMDYAFSDMKVSYNFTPEAILEFGGNEEYLMKKSHFYCNIIDAMYVELIK